MKNQLVYICAFFFLFLTSVVFCQTNNEGLAFLQLNFFNLGARVLAMEGAFVAMADDATAAVANPANIFLTPTRNSLDLSIRDIGISTGYKPFRFLSLGATVNFSKLNLASSTARLDPGQNDFENQKDNEIIS